MYTFIFRKIYSFFLSKKNHDPVFNASGLVFIMQLIHFFLLVKIFGFKVYAFSSDSVINKLWFYPIGIVWLFLVFKFFNSKKDELKVETVSVKDIVLNLILWLLIPLIILIQLSK